MAETKLAQKASNRRAVHLSTALGQFADQFIKGQIAVLHQPLPKPVLMGTQFGVAPVMALSLGLERTGFAFQNDHVIHEPHGNPKVGRSGTVRVTLFDKINNTFTQFNRMWLAHGDPPIPQENQRTDDLGSLNRIKPDVL